MTARPSKRGRLDPCTSARDAAARVRSDAASVIDAVKQASRLSSRARVRVETRPHIWAACPQGEPPWTKTTRSKPRSRELRQGLRPPAPRRRQDPRRHLRPRHRPRARRAPRPPGGAAHPPRERRARARRRRQEQLTLVKDVQKDPVHQIIEHIDLLVVQEGREDPGRRARSHPRRAARRHHRRVGREHRAARGRGHPHPRAHRVSTSRASRRAPTSPPPTSRCPRARR